MSTASSHPLSAKISIPPNAPPFHDFLQILAIEGGVQDVYTIFDTFFCNLSARHGLNGNQSKRAQAGDEVTNDTRMPVNPIQQTAPSMASTLALPSIQPQNWAMNAMNSTGGIPLDFLNTNNAALEDEDDEEIDTLSKNRKNRQNRKNKGRKNNKKSGKKNKKLKYGTLPVVVSPGIYIFVLIFLCLTVFERCEFLKLFAPHF